MQVRTDGRFYERGVAVCTMEAGFADDRRRVTIPTLQWVLAMALGAERRRELLAQRLVLDRVIVR